MPHSVRARRDVRVRRAHRGQGLVEFALIAPLILLLLLVTIDFGRALYGWVVLQNSARIAANFAGLNPDGWQNNIASVKARYEAEVTSDLTAANCDSFVTSGAPAPDPTFIDGPDQAVPNGPPDTTYDVGDIARVTLACTFHPITPIISAIISNNFQLQATSEFRIRVGSVVGLANPTAIPPPATPTPTPTATSTAASTPTATPACVIVPDLVHNGVATETVAEARGEWLAAGFRANTFTPASGVPNKVVLTQTTSPTTSIPGDCIPWDSTVTVTNT
jgi:hypothetical protein